MPFFEDQAVQTVRFGIHTLYIYHGRGGPVLPLCLVGYDYDSYLDHLTITIGAAVCILETFHENANQAPVPAEDLPEGEGGFWKQRVVRGLARMVQVSPDTTLVDITMRGVDAGRYQASIREYGDLKDGAMSAGPVWAGGSATTQPRGLLGTVEVGKNGRGSIFVDNPFQVWEVIGHAIVVQKEETATGPLRNDENTVVGVIARSAGMWDNDKTVCSCSGKTLWEERKDEVEKGMI